MTLSFGQVNVRDSAVFAPLIIGTGGFSLPGGDLADRFGWNSHVGGSLLFKTTQNWLFGVSSAFLFGNQVEEDDVLDPLRTEGGAILDRNGEFADILLLQRGYTVFGHFGKQFPWWGPNPNSGFVFLAGLGFIEHRIRIQDNNGNTVPALTGEYKKGYDRLTNGLGLRQEIGYHYLSNRRLVNFYVGLEVTQAFTRNRRSLNFDTRQTDTSDRFDLLYGLKAGWIIPLYKRVPREFYYD